MLADKIRQIRKMRHLSQFEVARRSGHPVSSIHGIENGDNKNPGFKVMYNLSRVLGFSLDELGEEVFKDD
jgi:transcriptional regulator with XRE-family HTH domain